MNVGLVSSLSTTTPLHCIEDQVSTPQYPSAQRCAPHHMVPFPQTQLCMHSLRFAFHSYRSHRSTFLLNERSGMASPPLRSFGALCIASLFHRDLRYIFDVTCAQPRFTCSFRFFTRGVGPGPPLHLPTTWFDVSSPVRFTPIPPPLRYASSQPFTTNTESALETLVMHMHRRACNRPKERSGGEAIPLRSLRRKVER